MPLPEWIDQTLSDQLPLLRDRGEGQNLEFMVKYPDNAHDLSREIAAFASSNAGTILLGVADDGSLVGLTDIDTSTKRDLLCRRIEGLCAGSVKPAITPVIKFAQEGTAVVLAIEVPRGKQPIYYSKNTPYVRHLSQSRPAEPHEVIERVTEWLQINPATAPQEDSATSEFLSSLAGTLIDIIIYADQLEDRSINPWMDQVRVQLKSAAEDLRRLASDDIAVEKKLDASLRAIADNLDNAAAHRLTLGGESWKTLTDYVEEGLKRARALKAAQIDTVPLADAAKKHLREMLVKSGRNLADLDRRADAMIDDGRLSEVQDEASHIGYILLKISHYLTTPADAALAERIRAIGRDLHLLETERVYMDGGQSMRRIRDRLHDLTTQLEAAAAELGDG